MRKPLSSVLVGLVLLLAVSLQAQQRVKEASWDAALQHIGTQTEAEWNKARVGGVTLGIVSDDRLAFTRSYGYADTEKKIAANANTVYRTGSIASSQERDPMSRADALSAAMAAGLENYRTVTEVGKLLRKSSSWVYREFRNYPGVLRSGKARHGKRPYVTLLISDAVLCRWIREHTVTGSAEKSPLENIG